MTEGFWILICGILVVVTVAVFRRFVLVVTGLGALMVTILACVIAAGIEQFVVFDNDGRSWFGFVVSALLIYAIANLIFQLITKLIGKSV